MFHVQWHWRQAYCAAALTAALIMAAAGVACEPEDGPAAAGSATPAVPPQATATPLPSLRTATPGPSGSRAEADAYVFLQYLKPGERDCLLNLLAVQQLEDGLDRLLIPLNYPAGSPPAGELRFNLDFGNCPADAQFDNRVQLGLIRTVQEALPEEKPRFNLPEDLAALDEAAMRAFIESRSSNIGDLVRDNSPEPDLPPGTMSVVFRGPDMYAELRVTVPSGNQAPVETAADAVINPYVDFMRTIVAPLQGQPWPIAAGRDGDTVWTIVEQTPGADQLFTETIMWALDTPRQDRYWVFAATASAPTRQEAKTNLKEFFLSEVLVTAPQQNTSATVTIADDCPQGEVCGRAFVVWRDARAWTVDPDGNLVPCPAGEASTSILRMSALRAGPQRLEIEVPYCAGYVGKEQGFTYFDSSGQATQPSEPVLWELGEPCNVRGVQLRELTLKPCKMYFTVRLNRS